ncbi:MAG: alkaline phosphatase family protein, partial [Myxococcales bacterium]|nr:alkaline phosphatase family protein [Myxococcales bacterium]
RSFDHYFGTLKLLEGLPVDGLTGDEANDSMGGMPHPIYPLDAWTTPHDPPHGWDPSHRQFNGGKNDGFVREYEADGSPDVGGVMGYYSRAQLPVLHALVDEYVLCERWYASVMGPTWPNRFHLHLATSDGMKTNDSVVGFPSLYDRLADKGVSARFYYGGLPFPLVYGTPFDAPHMAALAEFFDDAASGNLPAFSMIDPVFTALDMLGNDDHPPADVREGQAFLATLYNALAQSPNWERTLLVITYDEHGGFYDHAPPPKTFDDAYPEFQQLGFRVPTVIVGAQVRQGCAFSQGLDHVSVAATITRKFGLEPQNERVTKTPGFEAVIDPALITSPRPPIVLPQLRLARSPRLIVPGLHTGQLELAAAYERGDKYGRRRWQRASVDALEAIRDHGRRLGAIKLIG